MTLYGAFMALVERNAVPDVVLRAGDTAQSANKVPEDVRERRR